MPQYVERKVNNLTYYDKIKIGGKYNLWGSERTILTITPYVGLYPQMFTHVLKVSSTTPRGWTEVPVKLHNINTEEENMTVHGFPEPKSCKYPNCPYWVATGVQGGWLHCRADAYDVEHLSLNVCERRNTGDISSIKNSTSPKKDKAAALEADARNSLIIRKPQLGWPAFLWEAELENAHVQLLLTTSLTTHALDAFASIGFKNLTVGKIDLIARFNCETVYD